MGADRDSEFNQPKQGLYANVVLNHMNTLIGCSSKSNKLFIFKVGDEGQRTVDKWEFKGPSNCKHNGQIMGDACTTTEAAILKAGELMAYNIVSDLKNYFAIITHSNNLQDRIEIVIDTSPQTKIEMNRINAIIPNQTDIDNWIKTRQRILDMVTTTLILSTRSTKSGYIPLVGAELDGSFFINYFINPFTWIDSSKPAIETMVFSAERARIALSPIALILHESDHEKNCIFLADSNVCNNHAGGNNFAEDATIKDIDKGLGAHPHIAKRYAYIGGFSELDCEFPRRKEEINHGIRVFLDRPLPSHETPTGYHYLSYSVPALLTTRPKPGSGLVWIELPSDSTLRSGIKSVGPYKKP